MTHTAYSLERRAEQGISEGPVGISAELESVEDIIGDLQQALED
jgi:cystathionine beta-lyase/cystathionine gamma-synthase